MKNKWERRQEGNKKYNTYIYSKIQFILHAKYFRYFSSYCCCIFT